MAREEHNVNTVTADFDAFGRLDFAAEGKLGREHQLPLARDIIDMVGEMDWPMGLGVFGGWGAGKTAMLHAIEESLRQPGDRDQTQADQGAGQGLPALFYTARQHLAGTSGPGAKESPVRALRRDVVELIGEINEYSQELTERPKRLLVLVDDVDKLPPRECVETLSTLAGLLELVDSHRRDRAEGGPPIAPVVLVVAANYERLVELLSRDQFDALSAEEFLASVFSQRYFLPLPEDRAVVARTIWGTPIEHSERVGDAAGGGKRPAQEDLKTLNTDEGGFYWYFARELDHRNLRRARQIMVTTRYHARRAVGERFTRLQWGSDSGDRPGPESWIARGLGWKAFQVAHVSFALLMRVKEHIPQLFEEWVNHRDREESLRALRDFLLSLETELADAIHGHELDTDAVERVGQAAARLRATGLKETARAWEDRRFLDLYRVHREELIRAWNACWPPVAGENAVYSLEQLFGDPMGKILVEYYQDILGV